MRSFYSSALLAAGLAAAQIGPDSAPFPDTTYPEARIDYAVAGAQSGQTSPPRYPSPWMDGQGDWADAHQRAQAFVQSLTLAEKVNLTSGVGWQSEQCVGQTGAIPRLGFRSLCMQDSPMGIRFADYVSSFPAGGTIAASWDRELMYLRGNDMGAEHRGKGVDVQLGPVVGPIGRTPAGGRGWEGFSPDPYLSGVAVAATIKGMQDAGIMACTKHLIGNEQEHFRQVGEAQGYGYNITQVLSSNIDDRTMHELYLWPFADAVRAGTASIMCAYTLLNNSAACQNSYLLNHLLKGELGFQGFVMSDWQAQHSGVAGALAGMEMAMPGDTVFNTGEAFYGTNLTIAVLNGTVPEWRIDDMATRIMAGYYYVGRDKNERAINFDSWTRDTYGNRNYYAETGYGLINEHVDVRADHGADIRKMAAKSTVLLKNTGTLPLAAREKFTGVFGEDAGLNVLGANGCPDRGCDNGTLAAAWGSGSADFPYLVTPLAAIQNEVAKVNGVIESVTDNYASTQIQTLAGQVSLALVFVNADSGEGFINVDGNEGDRQNLTLWHDGETLIKNVTALCNNTVVVIHSVGPVMLDKFYDNPNVTGLIWAGLPGQESGNSIADILYGRVNPGGKLPFTMGRTRRDYGSDLLYKPNNGENAPQDNFQEGVFIDYRGFDRHNITPIYEFGYGKSYTTFEYSDIRIVGRNARAYAPTTGNTAAAPVLGQPGQAGDYVFPNGTIDRVYAYIYPYLNSTDLKAASGDEYYGVEVPLPEDAQNGQPQPLNPAGGAPGGNPLLYETMYTVYAKVTNTGGVTGDEVAQLYVCLGGPDDPPRVLRGFDRLTVEPGQTVTFAADLTYRDLANWDVVSQNWVHSEHQKTVYVGASSRDLPLSVAVPQTPQYKSEL